MAVESKLRPTAGTVTCQASGFGDNSLLDWVMEQTSLMVARPRN